MTPCTPSPCGPNSQCRENNGQAVCSCVSGFIGNPPTCRPECVVSSDCSLNQACINQRCNNPCEGACGIDADCQVINHNPLCNCRVQFTGDPFTRCIMNCKLKKKIILFFSKIENILLIYLIVSSCTDNFNQPLSTISVRSECPVSNDKQSTVLQLSAKLHWRTTQLSTRVY